MTARDDAAGTATPEARLRGYELETLRQILTTALQAVETGKLEQVPKLAGDRGPDVDVKALRLELEQESNRLVDLLLVVEERVAALEQRADAVAGQVKAVDARVAVAEQAPPASRWGRGPMPLIATGVGGVAVLLSVTALAGLAGVGDDVRAERGRIDGVRQQTYDQANSLDGRLQRLDTSDAQLSRRIATLEAPRTRVVTQPITIGVSGQDACRARGMPCVGVMPRQSMDGALTYLAFFDCKTVRKRSSGSCGSEFKAVFYVRGDDDRYRPSNPKAWVADCIGEAETVDAICATTTSLTLTP